jgi:predicted DNA-binding protein with PD1-like motif
VNGEISSKYDRDIVAMTYAEVRKNFKYRKEVSEELYHKIMEFMDRAVFHINMIWGMGKIDAPNLALYRRFLSKYKV